MRSILRWAGCLPAGLLICNAALAQLQGRSVGEVLDELRSQGLVFIYSTQILPPDRRIAVEPRAQRGIELAREILAAHGLSITEAAPHVYAVVHAPTGSLPSPDRQPSEAADVEQVVVQTSRYTLSLEDLATGTFLSQDQVQSMPRLADETLRALQRLPGSASNGFSSLGSVRGGEPNETAVVLDGLRLYEPFHLKNFLSPVSLLDSRLIDGIEFYTGGFAAPYGDRMSAIVDARSVRPEGHYYEIGLNVFHASALAAAPFADGRGHALLSARRGNIGDLARFAENDFGRPDYSDGFARIDYRLGEATRAAFDVLVSGDQITASRSSGTQQARARYRNSYSWLTVDHDWSSSASSRLIASFTDLVNERRGSVNEPGVRVGRVTDDRTFHVAGLRIENRIDTSRLHHRFGGEIRELWGDYDYLLDLTTHTDFPFPGSPGMRTLRTVAPAPEGYEGMAFWDGRAELSDRWTVQAGVRIDVQTYDGSDDGEQWSPRLSVLYSLAPQTHLRASWGRFVQFQGINELQVEDGIARFYPAQHADHLIASFDHAFAAGFDLRIEAYRKDYDRINPRFENLFDPLVLFPEAEMDRVMIDARSAHAEGIETFIRMRPRGTWSAWLGYTWSRVTDRIAGHDVPRSWDQRHAVSLGLVWAKGPWTATLADTFHSGWPTTTLEITDPAGGAPQIVLARRNRSRFSSYNTLDARLTRTFILPHGALDVFVELNNMLTRRNQCCIEYDVSVGPNGSLVYSRNVDSWLPLVPSVGVLWRY